MPFIVVEMVVEDELEIVGGMEWEWEVDDVIIWVFYNWWIDVKCVIGAWLIVFKVFGVVADGVGRDGEGQVVEVNVEGYEEDDGD